MLKPVEFFRELQEEELNYIHINTILDYLCIDIITMYKNNIRECKTFRECDNPRPWKNNRIIRHGLIKCKTCLGLWNRDTNASRNILHIVKNEITRKGRPEYLRRTKSSISGTTSVSD